MRWRKADSYRNTQHRAANTVPPDSTSSQTAHRVGLTRETKILTIIRRFPPSLENQRLRVPLRVAQPRPRPLRLYDVDSCSSILVKTGSSIVCLQFYGEASFPFVRVQFLPFPAYSLAIPQFETDQHTPHTSAIDQTAC